MASWQGRFVIVTFFRDVDLPSAWNGVVNLVLYLLRGPFRGCLFVVPTVGLIFCAPCLWPHRLDPGRSLFVPLAVLFIRSSCAPAEACVGDAVSVGCAVCFFLSFPRQPRMPRGLLTVPEVGIAAAASVSRSCPGRSLHGVCTAGALAPGAYSSCFHCTSTLASMKRSLRQSPLAPTPRKTHSVALLSTVFCIAPMPVSSCPTIRNLACARMTWRQPLAESRVDTTCLHPNVPTGHKISSRHNTTITTRQLQV